MYSKNQPLRLALLSLGISILVLAGTVSAAGPSAFAAQGNSSSFKEARSGAHVWNSTLQQEQVQSMLTKLGQQGVDISQPQAYVAAGNLTAAMQWMRTHHPANPVNATQQQQRLQAFIAKADQAGTDTSQLKTAIQNHDSAAIKTWLDTYMKAHKPAGFNVTQQKTVNHRPAGSAGNVTATSMQKSFLNGNSTVFRNPANGANDHVHAPGFRMNRTTMKGV